MINRTVLFVLLLLLVPLSQAEPLATSYWGYVSDNGILKPNALVTVHDAAGSTVASAVVTQEGLYQVTVPWDDTSTPGDEGVVDGETITFKVDGKAATSRAIDPKGTNNRLDLAVPTATSTTSSSGGSGGGSSGGGGGGGTSGENYSNIESKEKHDLYIFKDKITSYAFNTKNNPVMFVNITGNSNAGEITAMVETLKSTSTIVKTSAPGTVYKNFNIWLGTSGFASPKNIKEATISFKLENAWITSGGFKDTDIVLLKWDGTQWISLDTRQVNKDNSFTYFEAKTSTFSPLAISGIKGGAVSATATGTETPANPAATTQEPVTAKKIPGFELALVIAAFSAVLWLRRKRC